jgi:electron-transferring-flavoprotein dehydrogenase
MSDAARQRPRLDADIVCVGFGPASGGFLTTLARRLSDPAKPLLESRAMPGMPLQVLCYERADDIAFGVSGAVTRARSIRESFPGLDPAQIPLAAAVRQEKLLYLLDPLGASRRPPALRLLDRLIRAFRFALPYCDEALELGRLPRFLRKEGGLVLSIGQFNQWVGQQILMTGAVQIWPGAPVADVLVENGAAAGVRLMDQGVDRHGQPVAGHLPGMEVRAQLTIAADGPVGPIGRKLDAAFGVPDGYETRDWALGMKFVVDLPEHAALEPGTVWHTLGYPEPEIFGFLYVHADRIASVGIFVPSWFDSPVRTAYRYLQHFIRHPYLWKRLEGGRLRSWGAKSIRESGRRGEPYLVGDGWARIGEGSGSTNILTNSGIDEAWATGVQLAEAVIELAEAGRPFTRENLEAAYVARRRSSWVEREGRAAEKARDGFRRGFFRGLLGVALAGFTGGRLTMPGKAPKAPRSLEEVFRGRIAPEEMERLRRECAREGRVLHDALMDRAGWPSIPYDGRLLVSQQDALLIGGKVQAPAGVADHIVFLNPSLCEVCGARLCVEICSGEAIHPQPDGPPAFEREKCVHCGACVWNCPQENVALEAGAGGLHSAEN